MGGSFDVSAIGVSGAKDANEGSDLAEEIFESIVGSDGGDLAIGGLLTLILFFLELLVELPLQASSG